MAIKKPVHPGKLVKHDCLEASGLNVTDGAKVLGVSRTTLSRIVNCKAAISPEMAIRLSKAFGSTPEVWAGLQMQYALAQAMRNADQIKVARLRPAA